LEVVHTHWDNFSANASIENIKIEAYIYIQPNVRVSYDSSTSEYVVTLNPKVETGGGVVENMDFDFKFSGRDRNIFEQFLFDVTRLASGFWLLPEALYSGDYDVFDDVQSGFFTDGGQYNYFGTTLYGEAASLFVEAIEGEVNSRLEDADYFFEEQGKSIEAEINQALGNTDGRGVTLRYSVSEMHGKAIAPLLPALLSLL
jgi:hypothetical protein